MEIRDPQVFLDYLDSTHARTQRVIACIPREDLEWAPAPGRFSLGDLVRHLAGIERYLYAETAQGRPSRYPGHGRELADGLQAVLGGGQIAVVPNPGTGIVALAVGPSARLAHRTAIARWLRHLAAESF